MNEQTIKQTDLKVVLNGGSLVMESATIPFRWFFSEWAIKKQPTDLLIIDQNERDFENWFRGERSIVEISRGSAFMQFSSPGRHRIVFVALKGNGDKYGEFKDSLINRDTVSTYNTALSCAEIEAGDLSCLRNFAYDAYAEIVATAVVNIEVPGEFFAEKPESAFSQLVWDWANRWFEVGPRDECAYRKRLIWAFTLQPPLFLIGHMLKYLWALLVTAYLPLARIGAFYFGWRPEPLLAGVRTAWSWKWEPKSVNWDLCMHGCRESTYRVWRFGETDDAGTYHKRKDMPVTGCELTAVALTVLVACGLLYWTWQIIVFSRFSELFGVFIFSAMALFLTVLFVKKTEFIIRTEWWNSFVFFVGTKMEERNEKLKRIAEAEKPFLYFDWLNRVANLSHAPNRVDVKELPDAFKNKGFQRAYIRFWAVKRKVCKPYAR